MKARRRVRRRKLPEDDDDDMNLYNDMVDDDSSNHSNKLNRQSAGETLLGSFLFTSDISSCFSSSSLEALPSPGYIESDSTLG